MNRFQFFPRSHGITPQISKVIECFELENHKFKSPDFNFSSNEVLGIVKKRLQEIDFIVEEGKTKDKKIHVPVLFGLNNTIDKSFHADALSKDGRIVIEVEAGRAVDNNQFLKDIFQACMMFEVEYLIIAVRNDYRGADDFMKIYTFLEGILLIGY
jgi:hypothetical protein